MPPTQHNRLPGPQQHNRKKGKETTSQLGSICLLHRHLFPKGTNNTTMPRTNEKYPKLYPANSKNLHGAMAHWYAHKFHQYTHSEEREKGSIPPTKIYIFNRIKLQKIDYILVVAMQLSRILDGAFLTCTRVPYIYNLS